MTRDEAIQACLDGSEIEVRIPYIGVTSRRRFNPDNLTFEYLINSEWVIVTQWGETWHYDYYVEELPEPLRPVWLAPQNHIRFAELQKGWCVMVFDGVCQTGGFDFFASSEKQAIEMWNATVRATNKLVY